MNFEKLTEKFDQDGVILTNNFFEENEISEIRNEYDELDKNLTNSEIFRCTKFFLCWKKMHQDCMSSHFLIYLNQYLLISYYMFYVMVQKLLT